MNSKLGDVGFWNCVQRCDLQATGEAAWKTHVSRLYLGAYALPKFVFHTRLDAVRCSCYSSLGMLQLPLSLRLVMAISVGLASLVSSWYGSCSLRNTLR